MENEQIAPAEPVIAPVAAPETAPDPTPAQEPAPQAAPAEPLSRVEVIRAALKAKNEAPDGKSLREKMIERGVIRPAGTVERPRAPDGKFVPAQATGVKVQIPPQKAAPAPVNEPLPLPKSLKKELEPLWKAASPELQRAIIQRDADYEKGVNGHRTAAQQAEAIFNEFKPYEQVMRMTGANPVSAIRNMMPTMAVLATGSPQEKAFVLARALQTYGVPLEHIAQVLQGGAQAVQGLPQGQPDQNVFALQQQVAQLTQAFTQNQQAAQAAEAQRLASIADSFGAGKPNFDALRPQIWSLLQAQSAAEEKGFAGPLGSREQTAAWSEQQWIENSYNAALRLNPELYASELTRQREEAARDERDKATQAAQASRAAAVQVRGAPSPAAQAGAVNPNDRRAVIAAAMRAAGR